MAIPIFLAVGGGIASVFGIGYGAKGVKKIKDASDAKQKADKIQKDNGEKLEWEVGTTSKLLDGIGEKEMEILTSFNVFSDLIEKIQNRPQFQTQDLEEFELPKYEIEEIKDISTGAKVLLGGLGGAMAGTAGGFAASGAISSAVMALGTASTGTAISSLSGAAATNATLALLGGGTLAAGGGGVALGTAVLGISTLGVGLMVGGIIFNAVGGKIIERSDEVYELAIESEKKIKEICNYLSELNEYATEFFECLKQIEQIYKQNITRLDDIVNDEKKRNWNDFTPDEKQTVQNTVLLVGILYKMCKVKLVLKAEGNETLNTVNTVEIRSALKSAKLYDQWEG